MNETHRTGPYTRFVLGIAAVLLAGCQLPVEPQPGRLADADTHFASARHPAPISPPGGSVVALSDHPDLDEYRAYARQVNPGLAALRHATAAELARIDEASGFPDLKFTYTEYLEEVETRVGPQERGYALMQPIPGWGKRRLRGAVQEKKATVARRRYEVAVRRLDHSVRTTWAHYYYLGRSVAITGDSLELLRRCEGVARQQLAAGRLGHAVLVRLQVEVARMEDRLATLEDRRRPLLARFNALLDRPSTTPVPWPETLVVRERDSDEAELLARLERSPELTVLEAEMKTAEVRQQLARREGVPDFAFGVRTIETGSAIMPGTRGSGDDPWMLTVSVDLPLWFSKYRAQRRAAKADWQAARRRHHDRKNRIQVELQETLYARRDAVRRLSLYTGTIVPKAQEALEATEAAFRSGGSSFLDLIEAQRVWLEFQLAAERARADVLHADAELDRLAGPLLDSEGTGNTGKTGKTGRINHER